MPELNGTQVEKCSNCGADMIYSPKHRALFCPYCDSVKAIKLEKPNYKDFFAYAKDGYVAGSDVKYHCPNCDGLVGLTGFTTSLKCPFCGATNVIKLEELKGLKPDSVLPFLIAKEEAVECGRRWLKKKIFAPRKAKKMFDPKEMKGIYIPSFIFNADTFSKYDGRFGEEYQVQVKRGDQIVTETRVRWYNVSGTISKDFAHIIVEASSQTTQKQINKINSFDVENLEQYNKAFLAGYEAERYSQTLTDSCNVAKDIMEDKIRKAIIAQYNPDRIDYLNVHTTYNSITYQYSLLPIWQSEFSYKQKIYNFIVNGRSGASTGKAPVSPLRVLIAVFLGLCAIAAILVPIIYYMLTD